MRDASMESGMNGVAAGGAAAVGVAGVGALAASNMSQTALPTTPNHKRTTSYGQTSQSPAADQGLASIAVVSASGFQADTKLQVRILHDSAKGVKEVLKTDAVKAKTGEATYEEETKKVPCNADHTFRAIVRDSHTFGSDDLGEATFHITESTAGGTQEVKVGEGVVVVKSSFQPHDTASLRPPSTLPADSPAGKNKPLGRFMSRKERSVTPSG